MLIWALTFVPLLALFLLALSGFILIIFFLIGGCIFNLDFFIVIDNITQFLTTSLVLNFRLFICRPDWYYYIIIALISYVAFCFYPLRGVLKLINIIEKTYVYIKNAINWLYINLQIVLNYIYGVTLLVAKTWNILIIELWIFLIVIIVIIQLIDKKNPWYIKIGLHLFFFILSYNTLDCCINPKDLLLTASPWDDAAYWAGISDLKPPYAWRSLLQASSRLTDTNLTYLAQNFRTRGPHLALLCDGQIFQTLNHGWHAVLGGWICIDNITGFDAKIIGICVGGDIKMSSVYTMGLQPFNRNLAFILFELKTLGITHLTPDLLTYMPRPQHPELYVSPTDISTIDWRTKYKYALLIEDFRRQEALKSGLPTNNLGTQLDLELINNLAR